MKDKSEDNQPGLIDSVSQEIIHTTIDTSIEYAEMGLDNFLADGILKEIPIIKSLYAAGRIGQGIRDRYFVKKLLVFLKEFHAKTVDKSRLSDFKFKYDTDQKYRDNITEQLIIFVDSFLQIDKAKILAALFRAHIEGHFNWQYFIYLSTCLNSIHPKALTFLHELANVNFEIPEDPKDRKVERDWENEALLNSCGIGVETSVWSSKFNVSQLGKDLYNYGLAEYISTKESFYH